MDKSFFGMRPDNEQGVSMKLPRGNLDWTDLLIVALVLFLGATVIGSVLFEAFKVIAVIKYVFS